MWLHSLQFRVVGSAENYVEDAGLELDIADEFSQFSRRLGVEGARDTFTGLWSTQFVYNEYSLLEGDFLARGLCLDLLCDSAHPIPLTTMFLCLGEVLRQKATCTITQLTLLVEPCSVGIDRAAGEGGDDWPRFLEQPVAVHPEPTVRCSNISYTCRGRVNSTDPSGVVAALRAQCSLSELALPFAGILAQLEERSLQNARTIQITAS